MNVSNDPREVVESAVRYEQEGHIILSEVCDKAVEPLSRATFQFLADQELKHIRTIREFAASLDGGEFDASLLEPITKPQANEEIKGIFAEFKDDFREVTGQEEERLKIYDVALDMERRGHDFYESATQSATDDTARKLYEFLSEEEAGHFEIIQDTRDFLRQPDAFMAIEERWMQT